MASFLPKAVLWAVALFYAYGAAVHVANMASLTGFDWMRAPLKWQVLDVVYLVLDVIVAAGFLLGWLKLGATAFFVAAFSQIALYTVGRAWITDVPDEFRRSPEEISYLDGLVMFHIVTILLVTLALWWQGRPA